MMAELVTIYTKKHKVVWLDNGQERERSIGDLGGIEQTQKLYRGMGFTVTSEDKEKGVIIMKKRNGVTPSQEPDAALVGIDAGAVPAEQPRQRRTRRTATSLTANDKKRACQHEGCTEPHVPYRKFCAKHLAASVTTQAVTKPRQPRAVKETAPAPVVIKEVLVYVSASKRWCSSCSCAKPETEFDTSKDGPFGILNFICRVCEAQTVGA